MAAVTGAIFLFSGFVPVLSLGVLYVFAVLPVAVVWGLAFSLPVAVGSMLAFNFFFLPPVHTLTLTDSANWFALAVYSGTAIVVSELAARSRRRTVEAEQRRREAALLADIATDLLQGRAVRDELEQIERRSAEVLGISGMQIELERPDRRVRRERRSRSRPRGGPSGGSPLLPARSRRPASGSGSCPRSPRSSPSRSIASAWRARPSRPRRCGAATRSRRHSCAQCRTTCARR